MDQNPKQLVAEKLRNSGSVLVTVSKDPSVDQLASAIGLSLMLSALNKHATTVFSGEIPNTMEFLEPEKLIDPSVDALRDFIISISKDKADKLRYKVEDEVVKIFITPYQGKIDESDLQFSQGDFNVDVVVALGVNRRDDLDKAITSHGRILHDAAILTVTAGGEGGGNLGSVNWHDPNASSIGEMLVSISEALQNNILDGPMATAFLTGIVAATERFSNAKTTPKVMTMAAQLMAAGANQQLIASNLELAHIAHDNEEVSLHEDQKKDAKDSNKDDDGRPTLDKVEEAATDDKLKLEEIEKKLNAHQQELSKHDELKPDERPPKPIKEPEDPAIQALEDQIDHDPMENYHQIEEVLHRNDSAASPQIPRTPPQPWQPEPLPPPEPQPKLPQNESKELPEITPGHGQRLPELDQQQESQPSEDHDPQASHQPKTLYADGSYDQAVLQYQSDIPTLQHKAAGIGDVKGTGPKTPAGNPSLGGTFNATSNEAQRAAEEELKNGQNNAILSHQNEQQGPQMPQVPQPQTPDMIQQARQEVEAAMNAAPPPPQPAADLNAQPMPQTNEPAPPIHNNGNNQPPSAPPPLPPNPQMPPPPPNMPPPASNNVQPSPPPLPQSPNNVGQMYIPPQQAPNIPDEAQSNPFNQPTNNYPYQ